MRKKRLIKNQLKDYPDFSNWLQGKPDLVKQVKQDPTMLEGLIVSWKRAQHKKANLQRVGMGYRQMVNQIQELNTLLQRVDDLVSNVRIISEKMNEDKEQTEELTSISTRSKRKQKKQKSVS